MVKPLVAECDACGDDVVEGQEHDCPVLGAPVSISCAGCPCTESGGECCWCTTPMERHG